MFGCCRGVRRVRGRHWPRRSGTVPGHRCCSPNCWPVESANCLNPDVIVTTERQPQHLPRIAGPATPRGRRSVATPGPLTETEIASRNRIRMSGPWLDGLQSARRILQVSHAGSSWRVAVEAIGWLQRRRRGRRPGRSSGRLHRIGARSPGELLSRCRAHPRTVQHGRLQPGSAYQLRVTADVRWAGWRWTAGWFAVSSPNSGWIRSNG